MVDEGRQQKIAQLEYMLYLTDGHFYQCCYKELEEKLKFPT
jgi:hypothetical protein